MIRRFFGDVRAALFASPPVRPLRRCITTSIPPREAIIAHLMIRRFFGDVRAALFASPFARLYEKIQIVVFVDVDVVVVVDLHVICFVPAIVLGSVIHGDPPI